MVDFFVAAVAVRALGVVQQQGGRFAVAVFVDCQMVFLEVVVDLTQRIVMKRDGRCPL